ncbi:MarR family transcriptional regulator [Sphingomonas sanguinis]|uniref:MarR family transcriptional regulator n=1 Tax=Sphingomonas sanguinis TaxID=33051 RepID=A0A147J7U6_9SPHN|nr:helix-turn-helix domain-containing protein [Sphingomonas sanguinis]KTT72291.1 MarR family transcriptional regulator [Sphingomonas sanguinis]KTW01509.1 MarR family transcriptional regulator [Sphingomonas sanguinis]KTW12366.1 MarR family transcriptional regulator [Sphingomonas sanguinis]MBZ6382324.1 MarR family transcriptional regulator [Sphingomonas sanguinis]NNG50910.1 MarR family transcriptional regulator [Sphingomonas sanguinis]
MAASNQSASAQFLREPELRRGMELLYFGNSHLVRSIDRGLAAQGLGRAHHRALYFMARKPDMTVSELLSLLAITKQSLGRVLNELATRDLIETRPGDRDRRQRLLRLTPAGAAMEAELFDALREKLSKAYARAGQQAVTGFWTVLEGFIPENERARIEDLRSNDG